MFVTMKNPITYTIPSISVAPTRPSNAPNSVSPTKRPNPPPPPCGKCPSSHSNK